MTRAGADFTGGNRSPQGTFCFSSVGEGHSSGSHDGALDHTELRPGNEKS